MSEAHSGGDIQIQVASEEHNHEALAKSVVLKLLNLAATAYRSPSVMEGTNGYAMMVSIADPTTGTPIDVQNPSCLADGALSTSTTALYTAADKTWVTKIRCRNTGASTRTVTLSFKASSSATARYPWPATPLLTHESVDFVADEGPMGMTAGNIVYGAQDVGTDVDYIITGEALS